MVQARWLGAAGIEFIHNRRGYLIDPYFTRTGLPTVLTARPVLPDWNKISESLKHLKGEIEAVIVSHTHIDHALDVPFIAEQNPASAVIGSSSLDSLFRLYGMNNRVTVSTCRNVIKINDSASVTMIPSRHGRNILGDAILPGEIDAENKPPLKVLGYRMGEIFDVMLELDGKRFLHIGSADVDDTELNGLCCDILFICVPGWRRVLDYHSRIINSVKPSIVVPFHFDNFFVSFKDHSSPPRLPFLGMKKFCNEIRRHAPAADIIIPEINKTMVF